MNSYPAPFIIPAGAIIYSQLLLVYSIESARLSPPVSKRFIPDLLNYSTMICTTPESDLLPSLNFFFCFSHKRTRAKSRDVPFRFDSWKNRNLGRSIFRNLKISNVKSYEVQLFNFFIYEIIHNWKSFTNWKNSENSSSFQV